MTEKFGLNEKGPVSPISASSGDTIINIPDEKCLAPAPAVPDHQISSNSSWSFNPFRRGDQVNETIVRQLEDCPDGYPRLAAFLSSDQNFTLYRGFSYLHSRVLLHLQEEVSALERELDERDKEDEADGNSARLRCIEQDKVDARDEEEERPRHEIIADIRKKLVEYDEVLIKAREMVSFQRPADRDYRSVRTWLFNTRPIVDEEEAFIRCKEDIVTLRHGRECAGFDGLVESVLKRMNCRLTRLIFCTRELRHKTKDKHVYYFSPGRVDTLVGLIITIVIFVLLILPVVAMYRLTSFGNGNQRSTFQAIGVLIVFTLLFSGAMAALTKARRHELFAASAAYCAVLVVFISNFSSVNP
ncbi:MAG: hypothetical protein M1822_009327 [Bathelium mastoideum]|nr:MAG: hypothetical protein M1822_009327 [Bathelium mastoideum]